MRKPSVHAPRPNYRDKTKVVISAIRRLVYEQRLRTNEDFGFTMAQIAEEAGYARSSRFMDTLHCMVSEGLLEMEDRKVIGAAIEKRFVFRLPSTVKQTSFTA